MTASRPMVPSRVLLTGATGYIGGRLREALEERGTSVRCLARRPEHLTARVGSRTEVVAGNVLDPATLPAALRGTEIAYYLVHSMGSGVDFEAYDRAGAENFAAAARSEGLRRIVYLGGLGRGEALSGHLRSRQEVGRILRESGVPTLELRASVILGSGSLSFEMIRALVERLPVMVTPRWVETPTQPIAVEDVIRYLVEALDLPLASSEVLEIGGADQVTYGDLMREYARQRELRRVMVPVPFLTPRLSSLWLGLVTPLYARIGRELIEGLRNPTVVHDDRALRLFSVRPLGVREAIARALTNENREFAATRWSDALSSLGSDAGWGGRAVGSRRIDSRSARVEASADVAFAPIRRLGGETGWYWGNVLWRLRGFLDLLLGGAGLRRGRRDPERLLPGDAVDFWRVEEIEPDRLLRLRAEMRLPGCAWLQFEVKPTGEDPTEKKTTEGAPNQSVEIRQTAVFHPLGLAGLVYWFLLWPVHALVFRGMLRGIVRATERASTR